MGGGFRKSGCSRSRGHAGCRDARWDDHCPGGCRVNCVRKTGRRAYETRAPRSRLPWRRKYGRAGELALCDRGDVLRRRCCDCAPSWMALSRLSNPPARWAWWRRLNQRVLDGMVMVKRGYIPGETQAGPVSDNLGSNRLLHSLSRNRSVPGGKRHAEIPAVVETTLIVKRAHHEGFLEPP